MLVPVLGKDGPLMPTSPSRARRWIKSGKAIPFWDRGLFCVRIRGEPSGNIIQQVVVGIDPGSKREAFTVKSKAHTYLNVLTEAVDWVKDAVESRRNARRSRRQRKTPCRRNRTNRKRGGIPPSTRARWQWKLRVAKWLGKIFPITSFVVEDIRARTTGKRKWDMSFSPLEVGKNWFYSELMKIGKLETKQGWETKALRDRLELKKSSSKLSDKFECHNVDSWVLANWTVGGHTEPDNKQILKVIPIRLHRRQLHLFQPSKGGVRRRNGGTRSLGFKRGSLVKHPKHGICYVGGTMDDRISLHCLETGRRLCQNSRPENCKLLAFSSWRARFLPRLKPWASSRKLS